MAKKKAQSKPVPIPRARPPKPTVTEQRIRDIEDKQRRGS